MRRSLAEIAAQAEKNRRRLLAAEASALSQLRQHRNETVARGIRKGFSAERIADELVKSLESVVLKARATSRAVGISRLDAELASVDVSSNGKRAAVLALEAKRDAVRADSIGKNFAARWEKKASEPETFGPTAAAQANAATSGSINRIAATESSEAFNVGRAKYLQAVHAPELLRVWDAILDKETCEICEAADGTIVAVGEKFPDGEPGSVHPYCRCTFTVLTVSEQKDGTLISSD